MKCDWVQQNVIHYVYDELADDARYEFEEHVGRCANCKIELSAAREFRHGITTAVEEPSPNLLAASRMRLQEALETASQGGLWQRLMLDPAAWLRQIRFSPALAAILLIAGFGGGIGATYQLLSARTVASQVVPVQVQAPNEAGISGIRSISQQPGTDRVSIKYDTVMPREAEGSLKDQQIQQLLLFAARNNYNSGVRVDSIDLLSRQPQDERVREALVYALRFDSNPGIRLKALEGLGAYVKDDIRIRNAMLDALLNDTNPGVRIQALHLLQPVRTDSSVRVVLERLAASDESRYLRSQARAVLAQLPEMD